MKWEREFIQKIYEIEMHTEKGLMYDDRRVDKNISKFFEKREDGKEHDMIKNLRQKFNKNV